ncbi:MAG: YidC/Oxa1 family membrane protein insertase [bacterium]|nr:YidC/Oxa1 family membrane protein insertase [bacterium]
MTDPSFFNTVLVWPIINALMAIYKVLVLAHIPYALGFSIIVLTILIRFILYPFTKSQIKVSKKMQELSPHLSKLKEKHKNDSKRLQQETMLLYKEHGVNPAAGCLPVLIQMPIIWGLYSVLQQVVQLKADVVVAQINTIVYADFLKLQNGWDPYFFGVKLGSNPSQLLSSVGPLILLIPILTGLFQFIQSKMLFNKPKQTEDQGKKPQGDFASAFQAQSMYIFPVMIGFFSYTFPIGISLYWNTFTVFGIIQQYQIQGLGGLAEWKEKFFNEEKKG